MTKGRKHPCPAPDGRKTKRSRSTPRRAGVLILVHVLIAIHIAHWWSTGSTVSPLEPSEAMEFAKHSVINAGLVFFALTALSTLVLGRFFCGWACHLVALQDLSRAILLRVGIHPKPLRSRALALVPLAAFVYMFLWPVAYRLWVGDDLSLRPPELEKEEFWETFPTLAVAIVTLLFCGFGAVYFLGSKGFCTYACPYGALFGAADRLAPGSIRVTDACEGCGHCTITCTSNVQVAQEVRDYGMVVDPGCMKCLDCVSVCPKGALYFGFGRPSLFARPRREPRRRKPAFPRSEELLLAGSFVVALFVFRGLYQAVPFLFSLGVSGVVSFVVLKGVQLATRPSVKLQNFTLKHGGRLLPAGRRFLAGLALLVAFWAHSGFVQYHGWRSRVEFAHLTGLRESWFSAAREPLNDELLGHVEGVLRHAATAQAWGLLASGEREVELAWASLLKGDDAAFLDHMQEATAIAPDNAVLHLELGHFLRARGEVIAAIASYALAVEAQPKFLYSYQMLRQTMLPERFDELLAILAESVRRAPRTAALREMYASMLARSGDRVGAEEQYRRALELEPTRLQSRSNLADLLMESGRRDELVALLEEGARAAPGEAAPLRVLALAHVLLADLERAQAACARALECRQGRAESHRLMARILTEGGDSAGARRHRELAAELSR